MWLAGKKIAPTESTPKVVLDPEGAITIKGRSLNKNAEDIYQQIDSWLDIYVHDPAETTTVEIYFEYFNSVNSIIFNSLLKKIFSLQLNDKKVIFNWYYEEDDEDILSLGENISSVLNIPFNLIMIPES
jgi:hypothetical protein